MAVQINMQRTDREVMAVVGARLKALRKARKLTMVEVAHRTGLSRRTVASAEQGDNPTLSTVVQLLRVYGRLGALDAFIPAPEISPLELLRKKSNV